jgi:hypothetical protein
MAYLSRFGRAAARCQTCPAFGALGDRHRLPFTTPDPPYSVACRPRLFARLSRAIAWGDDYHDVLADALDALLA